jgi:hypothetical protein
MLFAALRGDVAFAVCVVLLWFSAFPRPTAVSTVKALALVAFEFVLLSHQNLLARRANALSPLTGFGCGIAAIFIQASQFRAQERASGK